MLAQFPSPTDLLAAWQVYGPYTDIDSRAQPVVQDYSNLACLQNEAYDNLEPYKKLRILTWLGAVHPGDILHVCFPRLVRLELVFYSQYCLLS